MNNGYVKLWRKSMDSAVFTDPMLWKLWCLCLMKASHKKSFIAVDGIAKPIEILPGQFITGRYALHKEFYPRKKKNQKTAITIWRKLKTLENMQNLNIRSHAKYSMITITNWDQYQQNDQPVINRRSTGDQPVITNKNVKHLKNTTFSQNSNEFRLSKILLEKILERKNNFKKPDIRKWAIHVDRMIRLDQRDPQEIEKVIFWCQQNDFWQNNILSTEKLREKFDQLALKMGGGITQAGHRPSRKRILS